MSFIDSVLKYTIGSESPRRYYYWSSLVAIASVLKDQVYLDKFYYKLYPNIYVLLVGRSGLRKGPPINLAQALVREVNNTRIYAGRVSIQGVITDLAKSKTKEGGGPPQMDSAGSLFASEFASFLVSDPQALTILTDLYDGHYNPEWTYMLKNSPNASLKRPCVVLFGATNEVNMKDVIPDNAIGGGFIARTFIIYADKKSVANSLTDRPEITFPYQGLIDELKEIARCKGEMKWSVRGKALYNEWYTQFQTIETEEDTTGTMERLHDHILKTAILISIARKRDMILEYEDLDEAIRACKDFVPGAKRIAISQVGKSVSAPGTAVLLRELITRKEHEITRTEALKKHWQHFDNFELDRIAESLFAQKAIEIRARRIGDRQEVVYILNPEVLERYMRKTEAT
jgi:hypothetical protein